MSDAEKWNLENAASGAIAGFSTVAALHPLHVVRTRFQVSDGRGGFCLPLYKNTVHTIYNIARMEGLRGLYAGFYPAVFGSTFSWGLYFFFYSRAKYRYIKGSDQQLGPGHHLVAAAEADAVRTIFKEEGWRAFYKGIGSGLFLVSHAAIKFCAYKELCKVAINLKCTTEKNDVRDGDSLLNSFDYAMLGGASKVAAIAPALVLSVGVAVGQSSIADEVLKLVEQLRLDMFSAFDQEAWPPKLQSSVDRTSRPFLLQYFFSLPKRQGELRFQPDLLQAAIRTGDLFPKIFVASIAPCLFLYAGAASCRSQFLQPLLCLNFFSCVGVWLTTPLRSQQFFPTQGFRQLHACIFSK